MTTISFLLFTVSCDDFLDRAPQGQLTQASFPTSEGDALLAVNAVYGTLHIPNFNTGLFPIFDIMSDDAYKGSNPTDGLASAKPYDNFTYLATEGNISRWWNTLYEGVKRANVVINQVPKIDMDVTLRDRFVGEALFLRAFFYFDLVRGYGDVPLVTALNPPIGMPRSPKTAVFNQIHEDLLNAIDMLPEKSDYPAADLGRATRGAAKSLLARVYLFEGDFVNTEKYALEVINSGQYDLFADYEMANSQAGEHGIESIFEVGAVGMSGAVNGGVQYGNTQGVRGNPNRGWGFNRPSLDLMAGYETDDPREDATIIFLGETLDGVLIIGDGATPDETRDAGDNLVEIECYNQKVWTPGNDTQTAWGHNRRFIRYADVLLMAAEALNENGKPTDALMYLNMVRERARGGNAAILLDIAETDKASLRDIIYHERRIELALEGHRFWDLIRTGRAAAVLGPLGFQTGKHELLPIPQIEMDLTQGTWAQNPGWE